MKKVFKDGDAKVEIWTSDEINDEHEGEVLIFVSESESEHAQSAYVNISELINFLVSIKNKDISG